MRQDEEKLILGIWDGTNKGCDCEGTSSKEKCSEDLIENGCKYIIIILIILYLIQTIFVQKNLI